MTKAFFTYFIHYIFFSKTRQRPLILAIFGLILSSFSLFVLQSTMGGLQNNIVNRSMNIHGYGELLLWDDPSIEVVREIRDSLKELGVQNYAEYELELLVRNGQYLSAAMVHGIEEDSMGLGRPAFLQNSTIDGGILGADLVYKLHAQKYQDIQLISPGHTQTFLREVPRSISMRITDRIFTQVPEVDLFHLWTKASIINNLTRKKTFNKIKLITPFDKKNVYKTLHGRFGDIFRIQTWEEKNSSLVWALKLESAVMTFLFIIMSFLVSISITTGLLIFSDKIKMDMASFWILGGAPEKLKTHALLFLLSIGPIATLIGLCCAFAFLMLLKFNPIDIMPTIFVERSIPVHMSLKGFVISFCTPVVIASIFSMLTFKNFALKTKQYLRMIRAVGV